MRGSSIYISILVFVCVVSFCRAQGIPDQPKKKHRRLFAGVPVIFYTPETRFGFGATGTCIYNWKKDSVNARPSTVSLGFAFTQNKQALSTLPFHLFLKNGLYQLYGEVTYNKFFYNFYGTGNKVPPAFVERYGIEFPRLRVTALRRVAPSFYVGPRYVYDNVTLFDVSPSGMLATGEISGSQGGLVSGVGIVLVHDNRNQIFYPTRGHWAELVYLVSAKGTGATNEFTRVAFDASRYIGWKEKNVIALNVYSIFSPDDPPFYQMGLLGGQKKMRGFYEGRYRDNNALLFQAEYRRWIKGMFGVTCFASVGQVARRYNLFNYDYWRYTYGAGIRVRLDKVRQMNLRIDAAVGNGQILPYFTIGEAF